MTVFHPQIESLPEVMMDQNHISLIASLVLCSKPSSILELGIGSGAVTKAVLDAVAYNQHPATMTCVDNFMDWGGVEPPGIRSLPVDLVISSERDFIESCHLRYDMIISDADHDHADEWIDKTLALLEPGGIIIYHDITNPSYSNLAKIPDRIRELGWSHVVFNKSTRDDERCQRGLLVVFKP